MTLNYVVVGVIWPFLSSPIWCIGFWSLSGHLIILTTQNISVFLKLWLKLSAPCFELNTSISTYDAFRTRLIFRHESLWWHRISWSTHQAWSPYLMISRMHVLFLLPCRPWRPRIDCDGDCGCTSWTRQKSMEISDRGCMITTETGHVDFREVHCFWNPISTWSSQY